MCIDEFPINCTPTFYTKTFYLLTTKIYQTIDLPYFFLKTPCEGTEIWELTHLSFTWRNCNLYIPSLWASQSDSYWLRVIFYFYHLFQNSYHLFQNSIRYALSSYLLLPTLRAHFSHLHKYNILLIVLPGGHLSLLMRAPYG